MVENKCDCSQCANWEDCEIKMAINNPITDPFAWLGVDDKSEYIINKGDKIGQLILLQHAGYLMPDEYTLDNERAGGFGSTGDKQ